MAIDPRRLRPFELARLLNSTPLGPVTSERQVLRHRTSAGFSVAAGDDPQRIDLLRYVAWLVSARHRAPDEATGPAGYDAHRERMRQRQIDLSRSGRDIGELQPVADPKRKEHSRANFRAFCEAYFPATFFLNWSPDHLTVIAKIEQAVLQGGLFALAMPRGSGKTSLCETACLWALLHGHRRFVALIGADEQHAAGMLESIKSELENNEALSADFPEVCAPIHALEGIHQRAGGQLYRGAQTHIGWTASEIVLPSVAGSSASGGIIRVAGITGRIRGMKHKRVDGSSDRPDLVLVDDPQTDESARSPSQVAARLSVINGAVLGLAGPGKKIAALMPLTVIQRGDLADQLLDRQVNPHWQGERTRMLKSLPSNEQLWLEYDRFRRAGLAAGDGLAGATAFYELNRQALDAGAEAAWPERFEPGELSAIQHAMNLKLQNEASFWSEYQNEPLPEAERSGASLDVPVILQETRSSRVPKGIVPPEASRLVGFIDVQQQALFYLVLAVKEDFTAWVVQYGTEPEQAGPTRLRDIRDTLEQRHPGTGLEGRLYQGVLALMDRLGGREWPVIGGAGVMRLERCLVDANWGQSTDTVYDACRTSPHAGLFTPSHGKYIGASSMPMSQWRAAGPGERLGLNWRLGASQQKRSIRHVVYDTNFWKSFAAARLRTTVGDRGSLRLHGDRLSAHDLLADHWTSEYAVQTEGRGRSVEEWSIKAAGLDNHWWDCLVGAYVAASIAGCSLNPDAKPEPRKKVRLSEVQARKWGGG